MISKNEIKYYSSLLKKKFREQEKKFLLEGKKLIAEALESGYKFDKIFLANNFIKKEEEFISILKKQSVRFEIIKNNELKKITDTVTPQGIAGVFYKLGLNTKPEEIKSNHVVFLDNISDPGNLGTILRNCDWFGLNEVVMSSNCAELYSPKTIRASMGSLFHLKLFEGIDFISLSEQLKKRGYKIFCSDLNGENVFELEFPKKLLIVLSNEAHGPSGEVLKYSDKKITIPKFGKAESLNVANASAVLFSMLKKLSQ